VCAIGDRLAKPFVMVVEDRHAHAVVTRLHDSFTHESFTEDTADPRERVAS
jgi:hypothetical protein